MPPVNGMAGLRRSVGAIGLVAVLIAGACAKANDSPGGDSPSADAASSNAEAGVAGDDSGLNVSAENPFAACATSNVDATVKPLDLLVLLDKSGSMAQSRKWFAVTGAIKSFLASETSAGVGVGIQFFPAVAICNEENYAVPRVEISSDEEGRAAIAQALDAEYPDGNTPMAPALFGAVKYAHERALAHPERNVAILLATDGLPDNTCQFSTTGVPANTIDGVVEIARAARAQVPRVSIAVIGVGSALGELTRIASAAGTNEAAIVGDGVDQEAVFLKALERVQRKTVACDYPVEDGEKKIDFSQVNVTFQRSRAKEALVGVASPEACEGVANGWHFDDPANPKRIELCGETCRRLRDSDDGRIALVFGCKTVLR
jgi:Mg-chelatase subunit ChlD